MLDDIRKVIAIDPEGCGCTECSIGLYVPYDSSDINEVLEAALEGMIDPQSNMHGGTLAVWRSSDGSVDSRVVHGLTQYTDMEIITPTDYIEPDSDSIDVYAVDDLEDEDEKSKILSRILEGDDTAVNSGAYTYVVWYAHGEYNLEELTGTTTDEIKFLWE